MNENPTVTEDTLIYAFRYALGRQTHAVQTVAADIRRAWAAFNLSEQSADQIINEIDEAEQAGRISEVDLSTWMLVVERLSTGRMQS